MCLQIVLCEYGKPFVFEFFGGNAVPLAFSAGKSSVVDYAFPAGRAVGFKHAVIHVVCLGYNNGKFRAAGVFLGNVNAFIGYDFIADAFGGAARSGKPSELFGADGNENVILAEGKQLLA